MMSSELDADVEQILAEQPRLRRLAMSLTRYRDSDADDLVQETVYRAYRARDRLRPGTSTRAWLYTILRRRFLATVEERARRGVHTWTDAGLNEGHAEDALPAARQGADLPESASADEQLDEVEDRLSDAVLSAVRCVPAVNRDPFILHALLGLKYREIAQRLGVPNGTVMSRIHRARTRMRSRLASREHRLSGAVR